MTNENNNSESSDFIKSIIKAAVIKKSAFELAGRFSKAFTDDDCSEFISWFLYRLGSKHGMNVLGIVEAMADKFPKRYSELLLEGEDTASETIDGVELICTDGRHFFSDLWDSLD